MQADLSLREALLLGAVQGPTELLPVSSSAHIALLARATDAELYGPLEVALHGGAALALLVAGREELVRVAREASPRRLAAGVFAAAPPALVGFLLERTPAARCNGPRTIAAGLALGGAAMALADRRPQERTLAHVGPRDGLALGLAQALALLPGVSRSGATLTAARARGFERGAAQALSWRVGVPVLLGATALRAHTAHKDGVGPTVLPTLAVGASAAFASTLASAWLLRRRRRTGKLLPFAIYRCGLALLVARAGRELRPPPAHDAQ